MSQITLPQLKQLTIEERTEQLEIKRAQTVKLLAADRKRAEIVLLQLRYQLDCTVSNIKVKG